jgi:hypothetical protein
LGASQHRRFLGIGSKDVALDPSAFAVVAGDKAKHEADDPIESSQTLADCFLQVGRLGYGSFDLLTRYEAALWRQAAQLLFILRSGSGR